VSCLGYELDTARRLSNENILWLHNSTYLQVQNNHRIPHLRPARPKSKSKRGRQKFGARYLFMRVSERVESLFIAISRRRRSVSVGR